MQDGREGGSSDDIEQAHADGLLPRVLATTASVVALPSLHLASTGLYMSIRVPIRVPVGIRV